VEAYSTSDLAIGIHGLAALTKTFSKLKAFLMLHAVSLITDAGENEEASASDALPAVTS
jgi:hypothetical protein